MSTGLRRHINRYEVSTTTLGFRVIIDDLVPIPEVTLSLVVGKEIQQAKKIPNVDALSTPHPR